jgi:hypothetical protein
MSNGETTISDGKNKPTLFPTLKEYSLFLPLIGGALAVFFDIGFFYGLQSGFFTAFTLSEHLVFALYATPLALFLLTMGVAQLLFFLRIGPKLLRTRTAFLALVFSVLIFYIGLNYYRHEYFFAFGFGTIALAIVPFFFVSTDYQWQLALLFATPIAGLFLSFMLGLQYSEATVGDPVKYTKIQMNSGDPLEGSVIRVGERGVLLYSDKAFILVPWINIRSVRNQYPN